MYKNKVTFNQTYIQEVQKQYKTTIKYKINNNELATRA